MCYFPDVEEASYYIHTRPQEEGGGYNAEFLHCIINDGNDIDDNHVTTYCTR